MNTNHVTHNLQLSAWANRIREQQVSGLNIKAWCYQNHFTRDQYYYWKRLLKEACLEARLPEIVQVPLPIVEECCSTCTTITPPSTPSTADGDLYAAKELSSAVPQSTPTSTPSLCGQKTLLPKAKCKARPPRLSNTVLTRKHISAFLSHTATFRWIITLPNRLYVHLLWGAKTG